MPEPSVLKADPEVEETPEDTDETIDTVTPAEIPGENTDLESEED